MSWAKFRSGIDRLMFATVVVAIPFGMVVNRPEGSPLWLAILSAAGVFLYLLTNLCRPGQYRRSFEVAEIPSAEDTWRWALQARRRINAEREACGLPELVTDADWDEYHTRQLNAEAEGKVSE